MTIMSFQGSFLPPGQLPGVEAIEQPLTSLIWGRLEQQVINGYQLISGASVDTGHTGYTKILRPGLLMTLDPVTGNGDKYIPWGTDTNFATDLIQAVMIMAQRMDRFGSNQDRWLGYLLVGGNVKANALIVHDTTTSGIVGHAQETVIRTQMSLAFRFDDDPIGHLSTVI